MQEISHDVGGGTQAWRQERSTFDDLMHMASRGGRADDETDRWERLLAAASTLSSGSALDDVLNQVLRVGAEITGARFGALAIADWGAPRPMRLLFTHGDLGSHDTRLDDLLTQGLVVSPDDAGSPSAADETAARRPPRRAEGGARDILSVPVRVADRAVGTLYFSEKTSGPAFLDRDEQVARALVGVAAMAIENSRLHDQASHRERWVSAASELVTSNPDDMSLQIVADWARDLSGADAAWIASGEDPAHLQLRVVSGFDADPDGMAEVDFTTSLTRCVTFSGRPLKVQNIFEHGRGVDVSAALGHGPMASALVVPLYSSADGDAAVTLAWVDEVDPARLHHDAALPTLLAQQAPLVLHVARIRQDERRLAVLEERDRIARDLHDLVIQQLFALGLELHSASWVEDPCDMAARIDRATEEIDDVIREIRTTIFRLGPVAAASDPRAAVVEVVERAARTMKVRPVVRFDGPVGSVLDTDLLPEVLAVITEALSNVVRHAHASTCAVDVAVDSEVVVRVRDDGVGMPDGVHETGGLANLRLRAEQRHGHLHVATADGRGTTVTWSAPLT
ncbi:GAF domain-containing sensor histidine kinase [Nocardioides sp. zg-1228]|uniref:GAF domain-containing sensor histidine kinase n=1 Tax=Nocardioides sp. zg-1228 TaxID=2763008 RepID=UPI00164369D4|nr:GAF domain-containing sensor histidine kinase [Nocardioides sp. zg-1228]MBC2933966.1 GAF domain-containing protein [Nocardioides sp. zg-1228]QSF58725.1 GAF domain-containing protein [Nocardioides sp. zg-1228]